MNSLLTSILFAARDVGNASPKEADSSVFWIIVAVVLAVVAAGGYYAYQFLRKSQANGPSALFQGLCRVHELDSKSRYLLQRIAQCHQMEYSSRLFLEPAWLDPVPLSKEFPSDLEAINALRAKLFE